MKRFTAALVASVVVLAGVRAADKTESREPANEKEFVGHAIACANHEIRLAELAKKQTKNADVTKFADTIITDHTAMRDKMKERAKAMNVAVVEGTSDKAYTKEQADQYNHLKTITNAEFDKTYAKTAVENHEKAIKMAETWSTKATDKDLGTATADCVAKLKDHKKMAEDLQSKVGG